MVVAEVLVLGIHAAPDSEFKDKVILQSGVLSSHNRKRTVQTYFMMPLQAMYPCCPCACQLTRVSSAVLPMLLLTTLVIRC